jgi:hypothetical protein
LKIIGFEEIVPIILLSKAEEDLAGRTKTFLDIKARSPV